MALTPKSGERSIARPSASLSLDPFATNSPFSLMRSWNEHMNRLFENSMPAGFTPQIDVAERDGQLVVHADLPGMKKEDVQLEIHNGVLTLSGERQQQKTENQGGYHRMERSYGSFSRSIQLPEGVDIEQVKADFQDGVLQVTVPLPQAGANRKRIPIGSSESNNKKPSSN